jgi:hypothetical protein
MFRQRLGPGSERMLADPVGLEGYGYGVKASKRPYLEFER